MQLDQAKQEYKELFTTSFPHKADKEKIKLELDELLKDESNDEEIILEEEAVESIIKELKNGKAIGYHGISNEMLKYAISKENKKLVTFITIFYRKIIETSTVPEDFNISIIKPLIKDNKKPSNNKSNLRPVAISDVNPNVFEKVLSKIVKNSCKTSMKQFGFKKRSSCAHAIFLLKQALKYARKINKRIYMCAIDASKAFDKVIRIILWWKLAKKGLNRKIL